MKAPQKRKTPKEIDHDHWEKVRLKGNTNSIRIGHKVGSRYTGFKIFGPEGIEQLRDFCNAWLEYYEETSE